MGLRADRHHRDQRVVGVEHGGTVGRQRLDQLALGQGDLLLGAELPDVGPAHVEHQRDVGWGDRAQLGQVADSTRAHLQDQVARLPVGPQHRQRQAELVVEGPGRRHGGAGVGQHARQHVLGRGLALGAGDRDDPEPDALLTQSLEHDARQLLQRDPGVVDHHGGCTGRSRAEDSSGAALDRRHRVVVPVDVLAREGDEESARLRRPAVEERRSR